MPLSSLPFFCAVRARLFSIKKTSSMVQLCVVVSFPLVPFHTLLSGSEPFVLLNSVDVVKHLLLQLFTTLTKPSLPSDFLRSCSVRPVPKIEMQM